MMYQAAPFPLVLEYLIGRLKYLPNWRFTLIERLDRGQGSAGLTLIINVTTADSYHPEREISVDHYMLVPPAAYDLRSWRRWLFDQIGLVERHERMENFRFSVPPKFAPAGSMGSRAQPDERPYAPSHGPGNDPYLVRELGTDEDQRTSFLGELTGKEDDHA